MNVRETFFDAIKHESREALGRVLGKSLVDKGYFRVRLAEKTGNSAVTQWLNGSVSISFDNLTRVLAALDVDFSVFFRLDRDNVAGQDDHNKGGAGKECDENKPFPPILDLELAGWEKAVRTRRAERLRLQPAQVSFSRQNARCMRLLHIRLLGEQDRRAYLEDPGERLQRIAGMTLDELRPHLRLPESVESLRALWNEWKSDWQYVCDELLDWIDERGRAA